MDDLFLFHPRPHPFRGRALAAPPSTTGVEKQNRHNATGGWLISRAIFSGLFVAFHWGQQLERAGGGHDLPEGATQGKAPPPL